MTRQHANIPAIFCFLASASPLFAAEGAAYTWGAPGPFFGAPVSISDRDESPGSDTAIRLTYPRAELPDGESAAVLDMEFDVRENPTLGYTYGGFAIPFPIPMEVLPDGHLELLVQTDSRIDGFQMVLRDEQLRRSTHTTGVEAGAEWQALRVPVRDFRPPPGGRLESAAFVVLEPSSGSLRMARLQLPVKADTETLPIVTQIQMRPKWYTHRAMAEHVSRQLDRPLVILFGSTPEEAAGLTRSLEQDAAWAPQLRASTGLRQVRGGTPARVEVHSPTGELLVRVDPRGDEGADRVREAIANLSP